MNNTNYRKHLLKNAFPLFFWEPFRFNYSDKQEKFRTLIKLILRTVIKSLSNWKYIRKTKIPALDSEIVIGPAIENKDSLKTLKSLITGRYVELFPGSYASLKDDALKNIYIPFLGLYYSFNHIYWYFFLKGYERAAYRNKIWQCFHGLAIYRYVYLQLKKSKKVKCFIGQNDHIGVNQLGFVVAERLNIKTIYIQHASVTEKFPPLRADLALLDGKDASRKYTTAQDRDVNIKLVGSPKYDIGLNSGLLFLTSSIIGICVNMDESTHPRLIQLCEALEKKGLPFIIRFHPHLKVSTSNLFGKMGWNTSKVKEESETDFILKCSTIISSDSNILLDALVLRRRPIYFSDSTQHHDYYGFLKNGILDKKYTEINEVVETLDENSFDVEKYRKRAKHFIDTINTPFEGKSSLLALKEIFDFIQEPLPKNIQQQIVYK